MKKLILILFLFSQAKAQFYPAFVPNNVYNAGYDFYPPVKATPRLLEWESWTKGAGLDIGYENFFGTASGSQPQSGFLLKGYYFDCHKWALQLKDAGAQYVILTIQTAYGFVSYDQKTKWPAPATLYTGTGAFAATYPSGVILPFYEKDDLEQGSNANFLQEFCYEMRMAGIAVIFYIPIHGDWTHGGANNVQDYPLSLMGPYTTYLCSYIQELCLRFQPWGFWFDGPNFVQPGLTQKIYNAIKSVSGQGTAREIMVINNVFPGTDATAWPYDIRSFEFFLYSGTPRFKYTVNINQINYRIGSEMVNTAQADQTSYFQLQPGATGYKTMISQTQAQLQTQMDLCKTGHSRFSLWLELDYLGHIPTQQLILLKNLN